MTLTPTDKLLELAIEGVVAQGALAFDPDADQCKLRAPGNLSCAVGQLIDDKYYETPLELIADPAGIKSHPLREAIRLSHPDLVTEEQVDDYDDPLWMALRHLQAIHDDAKDIAEFERIARA